jgi:Uma2 family endonuclease
MSHQRKTIVSPQEYLDQERKAEVRSEYFQGEIFSFAGASARHNLIVVNTLANLHQQLEDGPCQVYANDMRVKVSRTSHYTYPDLVVVCGEAKFEDQLFDTLLNPILLVEVLSPATEQYDRGRKFESYRQLESLREYVLITTSYPKVEQYTKQSEGQWIFCEGSSLDTLMPLHSIGCGLSLKKVYAKVVF